MNDADRAALAAWQDYTAARAMARAVSSTPGARAAFEHCDKIAAECFDVWTKALDVATLKGGR